MNARPTITRRAAALPLQRCCHRFSDHRSRTPKAILLGVVFFASAGCAPASGGNLVVCFGDSITEQGGAWGGYVGMAEKVLRRSRPDANIRLVAAGVSGSRVPDLERRVDAEVIARKPQAVVVYIGINDVWHSTRGGGTSLSDYEAGLDRLVEKMQQAGIAVILCTPSVIGEARPGTNSLDSMLDTYAEATRQVAARHGCRLVDLRRALQDYLTAHNPRNFESGILTTDGVHLNAAGNRLVAHEITKTVEAIDWPQRTGSRVSVNE